MQSSSFDEIYLAVARLARPNVRVLFTDRETPKQIDGISFPSRNVEWNGGNGRSKLLANEDGRKLSSNKIVMCEDAQPATAEKLRCLQICEQECSPLVNKSEWAANEASPEYSLRPLDRWSAVVSKKTKYSSLGDGLV